MKREFAFDVKLAAVVRVKAETETEARQAMELILDACSPQQPFLDGFNDAAGNDVQVTEVSLGVDDGGPLLFEVDGNDVT